MDESKDILIAALEESVSLLMEENSRYRRSNALLRRINSNLRQKTLIQQQNDENFKAMCQGDMVIEIETDISGRDGGLPEGTF